MGFIEKARSMSPSEKNKVALISAATLTALIVGIWFLALRDVPEDSAVKENSTAESLKPLFMIFKGAKQEITEIKKDAKNYKDESKEARSLTE